MKLTCNIDPRGRKVRLINGIVAIILGIILIFTWAISHGGWIAWSISLAVLISGCFSIFESRKGWCAVRAMGIKTPL